jgi:HAD superfamily hydrolase (TIGR01493 family)
VNPFPNAKWLFFDVGETLVDESAAQQDRYGQISELLRSRGIERSIDDIREVFRQAHLAYAQKPMFWAVEALARNPTDRQLLKTAAIYRHELEKPFAGATQVLRELASRFRLGVIANQSAGTLQRMCNHGWGEWISLCISSTEENLWKPDPAIYQLALKRAECRPDQAVMIGDRLDNDIRPAKAIGMGTVRVLQGPAAEQVPRDDAETPDVTVKSIADVPAVFALDPS